MKKMFLLILTFLFSASFLTSCDNSNNVSDGELTNASSDISDGESTSANSDISDGESTGANGIGPVDAAGSFTIPVVVQEVPAGFILLPIVEQFENGLSFMTWHTRWFFSDIDGTHIFVTEILDTDFIVRYEGELYINEEKFLEIYAIADSAFEEYMRNQEESDTE